MYKMSNSGIVVHNDRHDSVLKQEAQPVVKVVL